MFKVEFVNHWKEFINPFYCIIWFMTEFVKGDEYLRTKKGFVINVIILNFGVKFILKCKTEGYGIRYETRDNK